MKRLRSPSLQLAGTEKERGRRQVLPISRPMQPVCVPYCSRNRFGNDVRRVMGQVGRSTWRCGGKGVLSSAVPISSAHGRARCPAYRRTASKQHKPHLNTTVAEEKVFAPFSLPLLRLHGQHIAVSSPPLLAPLTNPTPSPHSTTNIHIGERQQQQHLHLQSLSAT